MSSDYGEELDWDLVGDLELGNSPPRPGPASDTFRHIEIEIVAEPGSVVGDGAAAEPTDSRSLW